MAAFAFRKRLTLRRMPGATSAEFLTRIALFVYVAMAVVGLAFLISRGRLDLLAAQPGSFLGVRGLSRNVLGNLGLGALVGIAVILVTDLTLSRMASGRHMHRRFSEALAGIEPRQAILLALLSGVGEELLFRGVALTVLLPWIGAGLALVTSSAIFAVAHIGPDRRFLWWTFFAFLMGLLLGGLFVATRSLQAPIAVHATVNGLNLLRESWQQSVEGANSVVNPESTR